MCGQHHTDCGVQSNCSDCRRHRESGSVLRVPLPRSEAAFLRACAARVQAATCAQVSRPHEVYMANAICCALACVQCCTADGFIRSRHVRGQVWTLLRRRQVRDVITRACCTRRSQTQHPAKHGIVPLCRLASPAIKVLCEWQTAALS